MANDNLEQKLWKIANELRGKMDSSEFKNYMLGFIFIKFLSERVESLANELLKEEGLNITYQKMEEDHEMMEDLIEEIKYQLGYYIKPNDLFSKIIAKAKSHEPIIQDLSSALINIEKSTSGQESNDDFIGLFDDLDLNNNKLGTTASEKNETLSTIISSIDGIEGLTNNIDTLGKAYEYLLKQFASDSGKKGGEFYTPQEVSHLVAKIAATNKKQVKTIYDPTCGSGSLLINAKNELEKYVLIAGQELNVTTFNLARMNMFLHGIRYKNFDIKQGDTLINDKFKEKVGKDGFDVIVANPPFGVKWDAKPELLDNDERFTKYGTLAPKSKGEFAFLQHMLHHLHESGIMVSVAPHGVLFRGAAELKIRRYMIEEENAIDAVIGLPANLFYGTGIPACIIVFKKCRENEDILFIDASKEFQKDGTKNILTDENILKIVTTYETRQDIPKYSKKIKLEEIKKNQYNLNIARYVDTFEDEEPIDLEEVNKEIQKIEKQIKEKQKIILKMTSELIYCNSEEKND